MKRTRPSLTEKTARARAMFGLNPRSENGISAQDAALASARIDDTLLTGQVAIVSGPSGSGKTTVLRALSTLLGDRAVVVSMAPTGHRAAKNDSVVDLFRSPLDLTIRLLSLAGLADAAVFTRRPRELSEGQRWRLGLALAMERVGGLAGQSECDASSSSPAPVTLIVDEFASTLDRTTGMCVAVSLRRWLSRCDRVRIVAATSHDDMVEWLSPEVLVGTRNLRQKGAQGTGEDPRTPEVLLGAKRSTT